MKEQIEKIITIVIISVGLFSGGYSLLTLGKEGIYASMFFFLNSFLLIGLEYYKEKNGKHRKNKR